MKAREEKEEEWRIRQPWHKGQPRSGEDADYDNQVHLPVFTLDTKQSPPEPLHMLMRIFGLFERIHAYMRGRRRSARGLKLHKDTAYVAMLKGFGVERQVRGVTGGECRVILDNRAKYCAMVRGQAKHDVLLRAMADYAWLDRHKGPDTNPIDWKHRAQAFVEALAVDFPKRVRRSRYLHVLANHAWQWHPLRDFSTQGLEAINASMKHIKRQHSSPDKKVPATAATVHSAAVPEEKQLLQMVDYANRRSSGITAGLVDYMDGQQPRRVQQCSNCGGEDHNAATCGRRGSA
jgi:hypothetical protein